MPLQSYIKNSMENKVITQADEHGNIFASLCYFLKLEFANGKQYINSCTIFWGSGMK